ncbi:transposase [Pusillimonas sp. ANT_WB101]|uniref:transposase n=1 Tax=Pusillimonas sp. ANT_WB101 TaxID=2597356 RepID=UPI0011ED28BA|nr:transposase [Pusillimonas sp. ANT_WB101]KAA0911356.1 transposase [Pusillimonas sp. ANT_WB101]
MSNENDIRHGRHCVFMIHVHLVFLTKGVSSRMIRKKSYPSIRKKLWGGALWSPSYFAGSCGGAPIDTIRQYIEQQQTPH